MTYVSAAGQLAAIQAEMEALASVVDEKADASTVPTIANEIPQPEVTGGAAGCGHHRGEQHRGSIDGLQHIRRDGERHRIFVHRGSEIGRMIYLGRME